MYVTIDSVMLQVQRYLHVNRQNENICQKWQIFTERESSCYATYREKKRKCTDVLTDPAVGWPRIDAGKSLGHLTY